MFVIERTYFDSFTKAYLYSNTTVVMVAVRSKGYSKKSTF